jgi:hypothetical protein
MSITIVCCSRWYGLKIFSSSEFCSISYSDLRTLIDVKPHILFSHPAFNVSCTYFRNCYLMYYIKSPAVVAMARLSGGPTGQLPRVSIYKGGFTHSMPCPCRSPAMPCVNSHMPCRAHAVPLPCCALIHTCHGASLPCSNSAVSVKVRMVVGNIRTASPSV